MSQIIIKNRKITSFQIIIIGFVGVILTGTFLLMLPISSSEGVVTPFNEALFTATSAVCVTGLVIKDTGTYWSFIGQTVILALIQTGGMGVITVAASFSLLSGKKISLMQRSTMRDAISAPKVGGIVRFTGFILKGILITELLAAIIMAPVFCVDYGIEGLWMAVFHAVSAFCNAGFDILGTEGSIYPSLTAYAANPVINITIITLIIVGGIGFLTWDDIYTNRLNFKKYRLQSKAIIVTTAVLIVLPALYFYIFDFADKPLGERLLSSVFQSVTPRTAGFNTVDLNSMTPASQSGMTVLMLIGGSPGSTAGGMKTTTLAVLLANAVAIFLRRADTQLFGRRIDDNTIKNAATIRIMYIALFYGGAIIISTVECLPMNVCLFETASAVGTVGLTLGITPELGLISQFVLIIQMFFGRVGGLTLIYAALSQGSKKLSRLPQEKITVG